MIIQLPSSYLDETDLCMRSPTQPTPWLPNGPEIREAPLWGSRPASQDQYRAKAKHSAGRVGAGELLGRSLRRGERVREQLVDDVSA